VNHAIWTHFKNWEMNKSLELFVILFLILSCSYGQDKQDNNFEISIDSLVAPQFKANEPGISILIAKQGQVIYKKAFGSANIELNVPLQPDMIFRIGSITKQFTAIAILQLVEQGKISLQDTIQKYIKDFPPKGYPITIENLLTHTSGIFDFSSLNDPSPYIDRWDFTPQFILDKFKNLPLDFKPGTKYNYSNSGYLLLGLVIEAVTGKSYHKYIEENLLKVAGLNHTLYAHENTIVPKRVTGYTRDRGFFENSEYQSMSFGFAAGDLLSTVEDLYKWNTAVIQYKLIKEETLEKAFTPFKLSNGMSSNYGYGWFIDSLQGIKCIHHEGQMSGFIAEEKYFPTENIYVAILTNVKSGEDKTDFSALRFALMNDIAILSIGKKLQKNFKLKQDILNSYVGTYQFATSKNRTLIVSNKDNDLIANIPGQGSWRILFESDTKFVFEGVDGAECEFILENGKVTKIVVSQNGQFVWNKIQ
jgi:CubicO group peptidase (beta-lactamase class C family)